MNIGLCRISSVSQKDNTSLSNQKKMIKDYCKTYGIELSNINSECYSGTTSNGSGLNELRELVQNRNVESVVVMKLYRLMRNFTEGIIFIKYLSLTKRGLTPIKRMRRLRTLLVRNGYSYRGKKFTTHNINYILRNSFYFGEMKYGDKVCKHNYETIISKRLFNLVNN